MDVIVWYIGDGDRYTVGRRCVSSIRQAYTGYLKNILQSYWGWIPLGKTYRIRQLTVSGTNMVQGIKGPPMI